MTQAELENAKVEKIASEYRQKGYSVLVHPRGDELPGFLTPFQPDLIATSDQDSVVVEIKSSADLVSDAIVALAEVVEAQIGWRLELAVVTPPTAQELPTNGELVPEDRIESLLREAQALSQERRYEAAAMVAWAAAEATFRRLAQASGIPSERKSSGTVLKQLYTLGLIDSEEYESFASAMEFRNAFSHGFSARVAPETVDRFIQDVEELRARPAA